MLSKPHLDIGRFIAPGQCLLVLLTLLLSACASKDGARRMDYASLKWEQRINRQMKDPTSITSQFQQKVYGASKSVKTEQYKAGNYNASKSFSGADNKFNAGTFSQAAKESHTGNKTFSGADASSQFSGDTFKTSQNRFDGQANSNSGKASPMADKTFNTKANPAALKATENSKRPLIQKMEAPSYTESEVRKLLNRD